MSVDEKKKSNQLQNGDDEWLKARSKILQDLCKLVNCKINKFMGGLNVDRDDNQASSNLIYLMVKVTTQVQGFRNIIFICRTLLPLLPNIQHLIFPFISRISSCHVMVRDC